MALLPTVVQTAQGATSAAAPASVVPAWAATGAGSCLVFFLAGALSGAPSVSAPAGWTLINVSTQGTTVDLRVWIQPNNTGGITGGTWTLTNFNGCAWGFFELGSVNPVTPQDKFSISAANAASGLGGPANVGGYNPHYTNEFWLAFAAIVPSAAITPSSVGGVSPWTTGPTGTSTVGATNVTLASQYQLQGAGPVQAQAVFSFVGTPAWCCMFLCLYTTASKQLNLLPGAVFDVQ